MQHGYDWCHPFGRKDNCIHVHTKIFLAKEILSYMFTFLSIIIHQPILSLVTHIQYWSLFLKIQCRGEHNACSDEKIVANKPYELDIRVFDQNNVMF